MSKNYSKISPHTSQNGHHFKKSTNNKCWEQCGDKGILLNCWLEFKLVQPLWSIVWRFSKTLKIVLPNDPAIPFLGRYQEKVIIWKDTCTPIFREALFKILRTWKQCKYSPTNRRMDNEDMVCIYPGILVSPKKNEILSFVAIWMDQEIIVLNDVNQTENDKYNIITQIESSLKR